MSFLARGPVARYRLRGADDPEFVPRVFGQLARRGVVPAFAMVRRSAGLVGIQVEVAGLDERDAGILAESLRAHCLMVDVAVDFVGGG